MRHMLTDGLKNENETFNDANLLYKLEHLCRSILGKKMQVNM